MTASAVSKAPTRHAGLTSAQVEESRRRHGSNLLTPPKREPWWMLWLEKFRDPVIRILIIAAVMATAVGAVHGEYIEGVGIMIAILLATTLAFVNEYRANREFDVLNLVSDEVPIKVLRNGDYTTVGRKDLVVDDIVYLEQGDEVPADARVLEAVSFKIDESRLTGESVPVSKVPAELARLVTGAEQRTYPVDLVLRGTLVADGHATVRVEAVGDGTELGKTARAAGEDSGEPTPLNRQLSRLAKLIGVVGFLVAALIFNALIVRGVVVGEVELSREQWAFTSFLILGVLLAISRVWLPILFDGLELVGLRVSPPKWLESESLLAWLGTFVVAAAVFGAGIGLGLVFGWIPAAPADWLPRDVMEDFLSFFMVAVTVIVVAVPEGLAMSVTLSLAYSMRRMTAENTLVRRMHACETIGAATVICSDKTGTLTLNEMRVFEASFPVLSGYGEAEGFIAEAIAVNSTANLGHEGGVVRVLGNPTEGALLRWLEDEGIDYVPLRGAFPVTQQWTFSTERKYMATLGHSPRDGRLILHAKGAPELLLGRCSRSLVGEGTRELADTERDAIDAALKDLQKRGMRTLGLAYREVSNYEEGADVDHLARGLVWLGFVAIADPIRPEVPPAVQTCRQAGVGVKMVTGDNPDTAREIARQIGLLQPEDGPGTHVSGSDFQALPDDAARSAVLELKVMSRARPMDKLKLVRLLQEQGQVVAVTGDGTNDAPALNHAHVGLAMGKTGTAVAKEASDIILLDDSFKSILNAVMWGRSLYQNIQRFLVFQLTINVAALGIALLGPFIGIQFPLTVIQMLWVNLIMDTFAALALATEPASPDVLKRPPRDPAAFIVTPNMSRAIFSVAAIFLVSLVGFLLYIQGDGDVSRYELSVFFTVFVMLQFWNLFNARALGQNRSAFHGLKNNPAFLVIVLAIFLGQVAITQYGGDVFRTTSLSLIDWVLIVGGTSVVLSLGEAWRSVHRSRERRALV